MIQNQYSKILIGLTTTTTTTAAGEELKKEAYSKSPLFFQSLGDIFYLERKRENMMMNQIQYTNPSTLGGFQKKRKYYLNLY